MVSEGWFTDYTQCVSDLRWHVIRDIDGHDAASIKRAVEERAVTDKPSLLMQKTIIGFGSRTKPVPTILRRRRWATLKLP